MHLPSYHAQHQAVSIGIPKPLPTMYQAAKGELVEELPYKSWSRRAVARFTFPDGSGPDGSRLYNSSPIWARGSDLKPYPADAYGYVKAGKDFDQALALAHQLTTAVKALGTDGEPLNGSQAILQARDGVFYLATTDGYGDEIPVNPGDYAGPAGPYHLDDVRDAGGVVISRTPSLKAVVGQTSWVDFRGNEGKLTREDAQG